MLIDITTHYEVVLGYVLIAAVLLFLPLAYLAGADSRIDEADWRRRYHG